MTHDHDRPAQSTGDLRDPFPAVRQMLEQGLAFASLRLGPRQGFSIGAINYFVQDVINIAYAETDYVWRVGPEVTLSGRSSPTSGAWAATS